MTEGQNQVRVLRLPPQNLEAEQSVLGAILNEPVAINKAIELNLVAEEFYKEAHGLIFTQAHRLWEENQAIDLVTLGEALRTDGSLEKIGGPAYLAQLTDTVGTAANIRHYVQIIQKYADLRRIQAIAGNAMEGTMVPGATPTEVVDGAEEALLKLRDMRTNIHRVTRLDVSEMTTPFSDLEGRMKSGKVPGLTTGFLDLDTLTAGLQPADLIIIAGRPSMGKTALALNLVWGANAPAVVYSLEMSLAALKLRLIGQVSGINGQSLRTGRLREIDFHQAAWAASVITERDIWIDDSSSMTVAELRAKSRNLATRLKHEGKELRLIVVDYLQLMKPIESRSRTEEVAGIARGLKAVAKDLGLPVVALCQLSRQVEGRKDHRPILADLRESGELEQVADVVGFVHREEVYSPDEDWEGLAELIIRKQRNGPIGTVPLVWRSECGVFSSADQAARDIILGSGRKSHRR